MTDDARGKLRDAANRERYGLRKAEERMAADERGLERRLVAFKVELADCERRIEAELRELHSGHDPERPLSWLAVGRNSRRPPSQ